MPNAPSMPILITSSAGIPACLLTAFLFFIPSDTQDLPFIVCRAYVSLGSLPVPTPTTTFYILLTAYCQTTACKGILKAFWHVFSE